MADKPHEALLRETLKPGIQDNIKAFKTIFFSSTNKDVVVREFETCGFAACLIYIEGMAGSKIIAQSILRPCMEAVEEPDVQAQERIEYLSVHVLNIAQATLSELMSELTQFILDGNTVVLADGCRQGVILETRDYEKRNVERTQTESVVVGSQQGFVENLRTNITLVRRMVRTPALISEMMDVGSKIPTKLSLLYISGVVDENALTEIKRRLSSLHADYVSDSGQLEELIEDSTSFLLPQLLQTERPDRVAHCLLDGQVAIMMDNSPYALIAPITLFHLIHASDDNYMRWQYGMFTRFMRVLGLSISLFLPGVYTAITLFHTHMIPLPLLTSIAETRARVPFPVIVEVLFMEFSFYLINEAGTRLPTQIGSALGIVGALILGQSAVAASIISPVLIIIVALTGLGNYVAPLFSITIAFSILRLGILVAGATFGLYGIALLSFIYACFACGAKSLNTPMFAPFAPYRPHNPDLFLRFPLSLQKRPFFMANKNGWLKGQTKHRKMRGWEGDTK